MNMRAVMNRGFVVLAVSLGLLAACGKQERVREIDWAKAALARNPAFEIVATDETAGVFTVRDTTSGVVRTLRLEDLIATPLPPKVSAQPAAPTAPAPAVEAEPAPAAAPAEPGEEAQTTEVLAATREASGTALAEGPGYSIARADTAASASPAAPPPNIEGPGYSITREASAPGAPAPPAAASNVEKRTDPIVCQGDRLMRIDGETIEFSGDAVIAEKGCDLYISNARIRAGGVGIIARQARVHIVNSTIGGSLGSYEASEGAQIYVARSTFTGVGRRFDTAEMNDLGGNQYQLD
jgi:hypothetical protein